MTGVLLGVIVGGVVALCAAGAVTACVVIVMREHNDGQTKMAGKMIQLAAIQRDQVALASVPPPRPAQVRSRRLRAVEPPIPGVHDPLSRMEVGETWSGRGMV